ncbi:lipopolysaccharide biosynthesis protein [Planosporangium flavigriseum]|uniref:Membrane protein n=1 Tax=Planosporangium flavigriseum TaxID=373681 RepID=A0A8J3LK70_9ACTN|nr:polysaccharide biosynthesis protein [Planosporangium flavigriseum]GIG72065.1 membrane protein [Planosporangium flavigriseum]
MKRLLQAVPAGTLIVGCGLAVLGAASYVHLAVASRALNPVDYSAVGVLWALVFSIGIGLFLPVEQEVSRLVAARSVAGVGVAPVLRTAGLLAGGLLALLLAALGLAAGPLAGRLFEGDRSMVIALCGAFAGLAAGYLTRGVLSGLGRFGWYGTQLAIDGGLRITLAAGMGLAGVRSPLAYALILAIAPLVSVVLTLPGVLRDLQPGPPAALRMLCQGLSLLVASNLLMQVIVNIGVINVKLLSPGDKAFAGSLLNALVLARVPLFVFASLQASLLPALTRAIASGDIPTFRRLFVRSIGVVSLLGLAGGIPAVALGPWLVKLLFGQTDVLGRAGFAWLAAGTLAYMVASVVGPAVVARGRHAAQTLGWLVGTAVLVAITLGPGDIRLRVELAFAIGSFAVIPVLVPFAWSRSAPAVAAEREPAAAGARDAD